MKHTYVILNLTLPVHSVVDKNLSYLVIKKSDDSSATQGDYTVSNVFIIRICVHDLENDELPLCFS